MRVLIVTAVAAEARAIQPGPDRVIIAGGVGRTNAACATTQALLRGGFDAAISAGVAGALPGADLEIGDPIVASECVYVEEGLVTGQGFSDVEAMGLSLGDFPGNRVPVDAALLEAMAHELRIGPIATVATCSGTDEHASLVQRRTGAIAEAMEGAAVVHAARRLHVPAIEVRVISNRTGERSRQGWDLDRAFASLGPAINRCVEAVAAGEDDPAH